MSELQITDEQKDSILRRGSEAGAFIHSPLFLALKEFVDNQTQTMGVAIALDQRDEAQKKLTREQFIEQMSGYYRGLRTVLAQFDVFISKANELQKILDAEQEQKRAEDIEKNKVAGLRKKAYPNEP